MGYRHLNRIIKKFILVVFLYGLTSASFNGFFGIYVKELGYSESVVGTLLSLRQLSVGVTAFLITWIAARIGYKKTLIFGLFVVGLSSIAIVSYDNLLWMSVVSVFFGLGQAAMLTVESPFIYDQTSSEERVHAFSLTFATRNAAFMTGSLATGYLTDLFTIKFGVGILPIRYALILVSLMSIIAIVPLSQLKSKPMAEQKRLNLKEIKGFFTSFNVLFLAYTGIIGLGAGLIVPFFGVYLKYMLDTTEGIVGLILSFAQLGTVIGGLVVPMLDKRIGNYKTIIITQLLSIPLLVAIGLPQGLVVVAIAFFLRSSLMNMGQPLIRNISMHIVEDQHRPLMSAMRAMMNNITRALGIYVGGAMMAKYGYNSPYTLTIVFYLIATWLFYSLFKRQVVKKESTIGT
ncbi:MAG: hypothetical protein BGO41_11775 [Clostridiales bacterium 38-18]|nr:MAG: hypothetical protein BGO41_11775 [Clostridiales bacterium 38-18]